MNLFSVLWKYRYVVLNKKGTIFASCWTIEVMCHCCCTCTGSNSNYGNRVSSVSVPSTPRTEGDILQSPNMKNFCFNELKTATRNFRPDSMVGEGGFGCVFKGWIDEHLLKAAKPGTGTMIAVKRLNQEGFQGHKEWLVSIISSFFASNTFSRFFFFLAFCVKSPIWSFC